MYRLFCEVFELPISWPLEHAAFASFSWINVGNTNLELWAASANGDLPADCQLPLVHGFALDPIELSESLHTLAQVGLKCSPPRPYKTANEAGEIVINFTNSTVTDLSSSACLIFFCAWDKDGSIFPWKEKLTSTERRHKEALAWTESQGGPLGITRLATIQLAVTDIDEDIKKWQKATRSETNPVPLGRGLALHLVPGTRRLIQALIFEVRSLEVAKAFLSARELLGASSAAEISLCLDAAQGLDLRFVEAASLAST